MYHILRKELDYNWRNAHQILSVLLYLFCAAYLSYKIFGSADARVWNGIFWLLFLYISVAATNISFSSESGRQSLFYYQLYNPYELFLSKLVWNVFLLSLISGFFVLLLQIFLPIDILIFKHFAGSVLLVILGIAAVFSFVASISNMNNANMSIMSILSLPAALSIILVGMKIMAQSLGLINDSDIMSDYLLLIAIDSIVLSVILLLFPYLWQA